MGRKWDVGWSLVFILWVTLDKSLILFNFRFFMCKMGRLGSTLQIVRFKQLKSFVNCNAFKHT